MVGCRGGWLTPTTATLGGALGGGTDVGLNMSGGGAGAAGLGVISGAEGGAFSERLAVGGGANGDSCPSFCPPAVGGGTDVGLNMRGGDSGAAGLGVISGAEGAFSERLTVGGGANGDSCPSFCLPADGALGRPCSSLAGATSSGESLVVVESLVSSPTCSVGGGADRGGMAAGEAGVGVLGATGAKSAPDAKGISTGDGVFRSATGVLFRPGLPFFRFAFRCSFCCRRYWARSSLEMPCSTRGPVVQPPAVPCRNRLQ